MITYTIEVSMNHIQGMEVIKAFSNIGQLAERSGRHTAQQNENSREKICPRLRDL